MIRTVVIALLVISVAVFIWYFVTNQESFSPCINCHLRSEHKDETEKNEREQKIPENEIPENEIPEEKKTLLDFDDFREYYKPPDKELESILKGPEEQPVLDWQKYRPCISVLHYFDIFIGLNLSPYQFLLEMT